MSVIIDIRILSKQVVSFCPILATLLITAKKLYSQDSQQEQKVVELLIEEMGLKLVWYKHLTSTGLEKFIQPSDFGKFARKNLPTQTYMSPLVRQYFQLNYDLNYTLNDYIILAQ